MDQTPYTDNIQPLEEENLDIKRWLSLFFVNWYWFAIAVVISLSAAYLINRYSQKIYTISSTMLIKDEKFGGMSGVASMMPGGDMFRSQMNLNNEIGIIKSFTLNYKVMNELRDLHVVYMSIGRRRVVESDMYNTCPFKVVYDSLGKEQKWIKVLIKVLSEEKYHLLIDGDLNFEKELNFGERFNELGFDFSI